MFINQDKVSVFYLDNIKARNCGPLSDINDAWPCRHSHLPYPLYPSWTTAITQSMHSRCHDKEKRPSDANLEAFTPTAFLTLFSLHSLPLTFLCYSGILILRHAVREEKITHPGWLESSKIGPSLIWHIFLLHCLNVNLVIRFALFKSLELGEGGMKCIFYGILLVWRDVLFIEKVWLDA